MTGQYGDNVTVTFYNDYVEVFHNVTEIHYNYKQVDGKYSNRIAFESDIHTCGTTYDISLIKEFESVRANKVEQEF